MKNLSLLFFLLLFGGAYSQQEFTFAATCWNSAFCVNLSTFEVCSSSITTSLSVSGNSTSSGIVCNSSCNLSCSPNRSPQANVYIPPGSIVKNVYSYFNCSCGDESSSGLSCNLSCVTSGFASVSGRLTVVYTIPADSLLKCSQPYPVSDSRCKDSIGVWATGNTLLSFPGISYNSQDNTFSGSILDPLFLNNPGSMLTRPNGSQCSTGFDDSCIPNGYYCPYTFEGIVCPLGFAESSSSSSEESSSSSSEVSNSSSSSFSLYCELYPNDPFCAFCIQSPYDPVCSSPSSDSNGSSSSAGGVCNNYPWLSICQTSSSSNGGNGEGGNGDSTGGVSCKDLNNCNWSRLDVQLIQWGVEVEIRDAVKNVLNGTRDIAGYGYQTVNGIYDVRDAINGMGSGLGDSLGKGFRGVNDGLGGLGDSLGKGFGGLGKVLDSILGTLRGIGDSIGGNGSGNGSGGNGEGDGLGGWGSDTTGSGAFGDSLGVWGEGGFGGSGTGMGDSLGNGLGYRQKIKTSVGIDSASFSFLGNNGSCPVFDTSFDSGILGVKNTKNIDLCDIEGYNVGQTLRAILWLTVLCISLFMDLRIIRSGGHS
jgi:hypothetical protein